MSPGGKHGRPVLWCLLWATFVVYGSLVPLQHNGLAWAEAVQRFGQIPFLSLGVASRADWIANGVLYAPLGFLSTWVLAGRAWWARGLAALLAVGFCLALAVGVEFAQLFFPPRTVSLNDLLAEGLGSALGALVYVRYGNRLLSKLAGLQRHRTQMVQWGLLLFGMAYTGFVLFPFDFLLSADEWADRWGSGGIGWWMASDQPGGLLTLLKLGAEVLFAAPMGWWWHVRRTQQGQTAPAGQALAWGLWWGLVLEGLQLAMFSGVSQGASVVTRGLGLVVGALVAQQATDWSWPQLQAMARRAAPWLLLPYLPLVLYTQGYGRLPVLSTVQALDLWPEVQWVPFYYHYYTSEMTALVSLATVALVHSLWGVWAWAGRWSVGRLWAVVLPWVALVEGGKLWLQGSHPDPTNLLIAAVAVSVVRWGLHWLSEPVAKHSHTQALQATSPVRGAVPNTPDTRWGWWCVPALAMAVWALLYPLGAGWVLAVLLGGLALAWWRPFWGLLLLAVALPVWDLAPLSGRWFWSEFDALCVVVLAVVWARTPKPQKPQMPGARSVWLVWLGVMAWGAVLAAWGWWGLGEGFSPNSWASYLGPMNGWRVFKGGVLGLWWVWCIHRLNSWQPGQGTQSWMRGAWGGLLACTLGVLWERAAFDHLWDFDSSYRVTGVMSEMHVGGAYLEAYVLVAMACVWAGTVATFRWSVRLAGVLLLLLGTYTLLVTFSRAAYLGGAVMVLTLLLVYLASVLRHARLSYTTAVLGGVLVAVASVPFWQSDFLQMRLAQTGQDGQIRWAHWNDAVDLQGGTWQGQLAGVGLGTFPAAKFWRSTLEPRTASHAVMGEVGQRYLRVTGGDPIGIDQVLGGLDTTQAYTLNVDVRSVQGAATAVTMGVCEKWLLTSASCVRVRVPVPAGDGKSWQKVQLPLDLRPMHRQGWSHWRSLKFTVGLQAGIPTVDVAHIKLLDARGNNVLANGDFNQGWDRWYMVADGAKHQHWRTLNMWLGVWFDLGWLGVLAFLAPVGIALWRGGSYGVSGRPWGAATVAGLMGWLTVALTDTLIDAPRGLMVWVLVCGVGVLTQGYRKNR